MVYGTSKNKNLYADNCKGRYYRIHKNVQYIRMLSFTHTTVKVANIYRKPETKTNKPENPKNWP